MAFQKDVWTTSCLGFDVIRGRIKNTQQNVWETDVGEGQKSMIFWCIPPKAENQFDFHSSYTNSF